MSHAQPSADLTTLARYIVCVYVPVVMAIKHRPDVVDAPVHICDSLHRQREHFDSEALDVVIKNIKRNSYMAHPENVLLAMLGDQKADVRAEGVQLSQTLRSTLPRAFDTTDTN